MSLNKTFREVVRDIKEGEIWCTNDTEIYLNNTRDLIINSKNYYKNGDINVISIELLAIDIDRKYKLKRNIEEGLKEVIQGGLESAT